MSFLTTEQLFFIHLGGIAGVVVGCVFVWFMIDVFKHVADSTRFTYEFCKPQGDQGWASWREWRFVWWEAFTDAPHKMRGGGRVAYWPGPNELRAEDEEDSGWRPAN